MTVVLVVGCTLVPALDNPKFDGVFQFTARNDMQPGGHELYFLIPVLLTFLSVSAVMGVITWVK